MRNKKKILFKYSIMKDLIRCKACGFVTTADRIQNCCPACGFDAKIFEPYQEKMSPKRRQLLTAHLHPIIVHFPQAIAPALLLMMIMIMGFQGEIKMQLEIAARILMISYPFTVIIAFFSGLFDGKLRFKRTTTPILMQKITAGFAFIGISIVIFILAINWPDQANYTGIIFILLVGTLICAAFLGKKGASLLCAKLPN